jgi:hypothetical protein
MNMYKVVLSFLFLFIMTEDESFVNGRYYGQVFQKGDMTSVDNVLKEPGEYAKGEVTLEGVAGAVCENKGCWMYLVQGESRIRVTFKDYAFFVPFDSEGKRIRVRGEIREKLIKKETLMHWEEEMKGGDPSRIEGDQMVVMMVASGVLIENGSDLTPEQVEMMKED